MANFDSRVSPAATFNTSGQPAGLDLSSAFDLSDDISWDEIDGTCPPPATSETPGRVAFRTKSAMDIMDDGFKWRKYGKKSVKNSLNPRNYYRCSTHGCSVKKTVERATDDPSYVITSYEGIHNHTSPGVVYHTAQNRDSGLFFVSGCQMLPLRQPSEFM
uniref:Transcription factor WRKY50 n=1 Tax=Lilium regale TaxID=82328 RepID=A0A5H2QUG7_LILRE|nr:transcription factor WRKY50 [Lilium regale]